MFVCTVHLQHQTLYNCQRCVVLVYCSTNHIDCTVIPACHTQVVLWGGLALFTVVVAYIVQKRMLFFVPNSFSMGFFSATARRQPGSSDAAHTNDPPPPPGYDARLHSMLTTHVDHTC